MVSKLQINDLLSNGDKLLGIPGSQKPCALFSGCTEDNLSSQVNVSFQIKNQRVPGVKE